MLSTGILLQLLMSSTEVLNLFVFFRHQDSSIRYLCTILSVPSDAVRCSKRNWSFLKGFPPCAYPGQVFACSCEKRCGFCGKRVPLQRKETSLHRGTLESFHKLLGRKNATTEVHAQLMSMLSTCPWAHDDDLVDEVEDVEDTLEQPLNVQTRFHSLIQFSIRIVGSRF